MQLPRTSYYYTPKEKLSDAALEARIGDICLELPGYGYRRVTKQLHREGCWIVNHKKVARIMRERGWSCRSTKKKWITTTNSNHGFKIYPNLIKGLKIKAVNQLWVADITYIHILVCFVYLAVILDVFSRKAVGYAISRNIDTQLTLDALRMALYNRNPPPGCIHHSDRGVQYASGDYVKELKAHDFQISMGRKANPYDNAYAESFIKTLKSEEVQLWEYRTIEDVEKRIPYFIEEVYNQKRLHSSLGYRPPCEFETMMMSTQNPCHCTLIATF
jgi:transposase InsO family protein